MQQLEEMEQKTVPVQKAVKEDTPNLNIGQDAEPDKMQFHLTNDKGVAVGVFDAAIENYIIDNQKLFIYGGTSFCIETDAFSRTGRERNCQPQSERRYLTV